MIEVLEACHLQTEVEHDSRSCVKAKILHGWESGETAQHKSQEVRQRRIFRRMERRPRSKDEVTRNGRHRQEARSKRGKDFQTASDRIDAAIVTFFIMR